MAEPPPAPNSTAAAALDEPLLGRTEAGAQLALRLAGLGTWEVACGDPEEIDHWPIRWSNEASRILGLNPAGDSGSRAQLRMLIHADDRSQRDQIADRAWLEGRPYSVDYRIHRSDGVMRVITEQARVFPEPHGGSQRIFGVVQDITERREIDRALRDYNLLLRGVTRAQACFIAGRPQQETFGELLTCLLNYTDSEFGYIGERVAGEGAERLYFCATAGSGWDSAAQEFYGTSELTGVALGDWAQTLGLAHGPFICNTPDPPSALSDFLPGHPPVRNYMLLPFAHDEGIHGVIGLANSPEGYSTRAPRRLDALLNTSASLVWAHRANERRRCAEAELVTLNAQLEARVRQRTAELEAANQELETFSYSVSHDLRAPLRGIDGWSLALTEDFGAQLPQKAQEYLGQVRGEVQRMSELIEDLLELSRVTRVDLQWQDVDMTELAQSIVAKLRAQHADRSVDVAVQPGVTARGDPGLLRVVMQNLFDNAWKFTGPLGEVREKNSAGVARDAMTMLLSGESQRARVEFGTVANASRPVYYVRDNGAGFDMRYAGKLFSPFRRMHRQSEFPGTGVGLATVQRIIRRHGGVVWAEADLGKGATFFFTIASNK
jgi:PAS domain S-box-containing protein